MSGKGPYSRIYWTLVDDPMFEGIYDTPTLATWLRMLLVADAMYPASAPIGRRNPAINKIIASGLVEERPGNRYTMRGLEAERERRSEIGRNAAAVRYQSERTANAMPRRDETSIEEKSNGQSPKSFISYPARSPVERLPGEAVALVHDGKHRDADQCGVCHPLPREAVGES